MEGIWDGVRVRWPLDIGGGGNSCSWVNRGEAVSNWRSIESRESSVIMTF